MLGSLTSDEIEQVLHKQAVGRIGCHHNGRTYVVPVTYAYDGARIIAHSAEGLKLRMMRANPEVCFQVDEIHDMADWKSVIAWGAFRELRTMEAAQAMSFLVERMTNRNTSETAHIPLNAHTGGPVKACVYEIAVREKTGRFEKR